MVIRRHVVGVVVVVAVVAAAVPLHFEPGSRNQSTTTSNLHTKSIMPLNKRSLDSYLVNL